VPNLVYNGLNFRRCDQFKSPRLRLAAPFLPNQSSKQVGKGRPERSSKS
jgi:hypothetical protein